MCPPLEFPDLAEIPADTALVNPNHPVWLSEHLDGRHSQVFAYRLAGEESATRILRGSGLSRTMVYKALADLREAGLLDGAADMPALEVSGEQRIERIRKRVTDSLDRKQQYEKQAEEEHTEVQVPPSSPPPGWLTPSGWPLGPEAPC